MRSISTTHGASDGRSVVFIRFAPVAIPAVSRGASSAVRGVSALDSIDLPSAAVDELVIIRHGLAQPVISHQPLLDREELVDGFRPRFSDDGPEALAADIGEYA